MSYADLSKIIPRDDASNDEWLKNYIEKDRLAKEEEEAVELAAKQFLSPDGREGREPAGRSLPQESPEKILVKRKKRRTVYIEDDDNSEEVKRLTISLHRFQESYERLELFGKVIPDTLKDKAAKALETEDVDKLRVAELLLKSCLGGNICSPPTQADFIMGTVHPIIETYATRMGYNLTGFTQVANKACAMPLLSYLIRHDPLSGYQLPPAAELALAYAGAIAMVYTINKSNKAQNVPSPNPAEGSQQAEILFSTEPPCHSQTGPCDLSMPLPNLD